MEHRRTLPGLVLLALATACASAAGAAGQSGSASPGSGPGRQANMHTASGGQPVQQQRNRHGKPVRGGQRTAPALPPAPLANAQPSLAPRQLLVPGAALQHIRPALQTEAEEEQAAQLRTVPRAAPQGLLVAQTSFTPLQMDVNADCCDAPVKPRETEKAPRNLLRPQATDLVLLNRSQPADH